MNKPLVSVICLCYNHRHYVIESMASVLAQTYANIELIVVDDASSDGSQEIISEYCLSHPAVKKLLLDNNLGNCASFNRGWQLANGKYIIDLAADDMLLPERVVRGVEMLESKGEGFGVHFSDVRIIDGAGRTVREHLTSEYYSPVPEGYIFRQLLEKYFINPVSMMLSNRLLEDLDGFDEDLAYEDFDLWVRSAKTYQYCYSPEILMLKRQLPGSHSTRQYKFRSALLASTYNVCEKAFMLCEAQEDFRALKKRLLFEFRKSLQTFNLNTAASYLGLLGKVNKRLRELS